MAGIYIHIPFCIKKCHYCDFFSRTSSELIPEIIESEILEIEYRKNYLHGEIINSIYFGGGTPSILSLKHIEMLLIAIRKNFRVSNDCEVTFECNPDDLNNQYFSELKSIGINRISLGVQSLDDNLLNVLNRRHNADQARKSIVLAKEAQFNSVSIDLIFGIPGMSTEAYVKVLKEIINYNVEHVSAYQLTFEPGTVLYKFLQKNVIQPAPEEDILNQFDTTIDILEKCGYGHYEISNYARRGYESMHNWNYWNNGKYIGIGPSAHSYDGQSRQWNVSNLRKYINFLKTNNYFEREILTETDRYNEYILTSLRTKSGISEKIVEKNYNIDICKHLRIKMQEFINERYIEEINDRNYVLTRKGIYILDLIVQKFCY